MKKILILTLFVAATLYMHTVSHAAIGCLDDKIYVNTPGGERYQPVSCTCPCWRYKHSLDRNRCTECFHYRDPRNLQY